MGCAPKAAPGTTYGTRTLPSLVAAKVTVALSALNSGEIGAWVGAISPGLDLSGGVGGVEK